MLRLLGLQEGRGKTARKTELVPKSTSRDLEVTKNTSKAQKYQEIPDST